VLTAARDGADYIGEAIGSVLAQGVPVEYIIVDDGSRDGTAEAVRPFIGKVRYLRQAPAGAGAALNNGLSRSRAEFVAFIDADDIWAPNKLSLQMAALDAEPELDMVFGHYVEFASGEALAQPGRWAVRGEPQPGHSSGGVLMRRAALNRVGPFDERLALGCFVDLFARARDAGLLERTTADVVYRRRVHGKNSTIVQAAHRGDYLAIARAAIARKRAAAGDRRS
jgi:glycosyltransferase involved in cell wall biosynthesis